MKIWASLFYSGKEGEEVLKNFRLNERYHPSQETQAVVDAKCQ